MAAMPADPLNADPRTASVQGPRTNRRELSKRAQALLRTLGPGEHAQWALLSTGMRPKVGAITDSRLILFSIAELGPAPQVLVAPYTLMDGNKKIVGQAVTVRDRHGTQADLILSALDLQELRRAAGVLATPDTSPGTSTAGSAGGSDVGDEVRRNDPRTGPIHGQATAAGGWRWGRPVMSWQDAELMAADHMRHLRFSGVTLTPAGRDNGLDVIARTGAAQVKYHATPTGAPEIQRLRGAADGFETRLFYATAYTTEAFAAAEALGVAAFQFTTSGDVVAVNGPAQRLLTTQAPPSPGPQRGALGQLTRQGRQERALEWAQQIQGAAASPISNRRRKGASQLADRQQALRLMVAGLAQVQDSENPLYKRTRKDRTMAEAEKTLKQAAALLGVRLR